MGSRGLLSLHIGRGSRKVEPRPARYAGVAHDLLGTREGAHGTGDIYASAFTGALMNDKDIFEAARIAADYTVRCIINTQGDSEHWYGAKFETALRDLMEMLRR